MNKQNKKVELILYNNVLNLTRNKLIYTKFGLLDSFHNRIILIFFHISFILIKFTKIKNKSNIQGFDQNLFDTMFNQIEMNMRELGYGDVTVNKNMKFLVKEFYNILLFCSDFDKKKEVSKSAFFNHHLKLNSNKEMGNYDSLIDYFANFKTFCFDLSLDSVLKGELKFKFN